MENENFQEPAENGWQALEGRIRQLQDQEEIMVALNDAREVASVFADESRKKGSEGKIKYKGAFTMVLNRALNRIAQHDAQLALEVYQQFQKEFPPQE